MTHDSCRLAILALVVVVCRFAIAETLYLSTNVNGNSSAQYDAFTNSIWWAESDPTGATGDVPSPLDPNTDYAIYNVSKMSLYYRTANTAANGCECHFTGKSLKLGKGNAQGCGYFYTSRPAKLYFDNDGLFLECGWTKLQKDANYDVYGKVTVLKSYELQAAAAGRTVCFHGPLYGESGTELNLSYDSKHHPLTANFEDISGFHGTIVAAKVSDDGTVGTTLGASGSGCDATINIGSGCWLQTATPSNDLELAALTLPDGAGIALNNRVWKDAAGEGHRTNGTIRVTGSLVLSGKVRLKLAEALFAFDGCPTRYEIITAPAGTGLDAAQFEFDCGDAMLERYVTFEVESDSSGERLVLSVEPLVRMVRSDSTAQTDINKSTCSAVTNAASWSDGKVPHADANYLVITNGTTAKLYMLDTEGGCRASTNDTVTSVFAGKSLLVGDACSIILFANRGGFEVKKLTLLDGSALKVGQFTIPLLTCERLEMPSGTVSFSSFSDKILAVNAPCFGAAEISMCGLSGTGSPEGSYRFDGDMSGFYGRMTVTQLDNPNRPSYVKGNFAGCNQTLNLNRAEALGHDLETPDYRAIKLEKDCAIRCPSNVTVLASSNRGLFIDKPVVGTNHCGVVEVQGASTELRFETPLTINGTLYKIGTGTLTLAGPLKFGADGAGTDPIQGLNKFDLRRGNLRIAGAGSVDGLEIAVSNNSTRVILEANLADSELTRYGIRNVKTDSPFVLDDGLTGLPLTVDYPAAADVPEDGVVLGIVTVRDEAAAAVRAMLPAFPSRVSGRRARFVEVLDEERGWVTFALDMERRGLVVILK